MTLTELLHRNREAITRRWFEETLSSYPEEGALLFAGQEDRFANPVGHGLRAGTKAVFDALLEGSDDLAAGRLLEEIVRIRAVQQFSPSEAVGFVFRLKDVVREELGDVVDDPELSREMLRFEKRIDHVALAAFDLYMECREHVCELRVNEVKRRVAWILEKLNRRRDGSFDAGMERAPAGPLGGERGRGSG